jgi:uncharacterized protein YggE
MSLNKVESFQAAAKGVFYLVAALLIVPLIIGSFTGIGQGAWFKNIKAEVTEQPYARTVAVSGEGKISARPDVAFVTLSVQSVGKTVAQVTQDNNTKMNQVIAEMKKIGIKEDDITTTSYNLYPRYNEIKPVDPEIKELVAQTPQIIGYTLDQSLSLKIRDLTKVDQVLDRGVAVGANQVGGLNFDIDDASKIKSEAREQAFQKAREKAEAMAKAAGVRLGRVVTFSESYGSYPMYANYLMDAKTESYAAGAPSIQAGSKELSVNVSVTYEIE